MQIGEEGQNLKLYQISRSLTIFLTGIFWPGISATQNPESGISTDRQPSRRRGDSTVNPLFFSSFLAPQPKKKKIIHSHGGSYNNSTKRLPQRPKTLKKENLPLQSENLWSQGIGWTRYSCFSLCPSTAWPQTCIIIAKTRNKPSVLGWWIDTQIVSYPMIEKYTAIKKNKLLADSTTWMNLKCMMLSERSPSQKVCMLYWIPFIQHSGEDKNIMTENTSVIARC